MSTWTVGEYWNKDGTGHALAVWPHPPVSERAARRRSRRTQKAHNMIKQTIAYDCGEHLHRDRNEALRCARSQRGHERFMRDEANSRRVGIAELVFPNRIAGLLSSIAEEDRASR